MVYLLLSLLLQLRLIFFSARKLALIGTLAVTRLRPHVYIGPISIKGEVVKELTLKIVFFFFFKLDNFFNSGDRRR